jgi:hypothetical protein
MTGVQNSAGTYDEVNNKCWGNTFVLRGSGEWYSSHLTITMDYVDGQPNPDKGNSIVTGNWMLVLYKDDEYFATVYGQVIQGDIFWEIDPKSQLAVKRTTSAMLKPSGMVDGSMKFYSTLTSMTFEADTRLDGPTAVTAAMLKTGF